MARLKMAHRQGLWASPFMPTWFGSALASYPAAAPYGSFLAPPRPVLPGSAVSPQSVQVGVPPHLHPTSIAAPTPIHAVTSVASPRLVAPQQWIHVTAFSPMIGPWHQCVCVRTMVIGLCKTMWPSYRITDKITDWHCRESSSWTQLARFSQTRV